MTNPQPTSVDTKARRLSTAALVLSLVSTAAAVFSSFNTFRSAESAIAQVRPIISPSVEGPVQVADQMTVPVRIENVGKSRACVDAVRIVFWRGAEQSSYFEMPQCRGDIVYANQSARYTFNVARFQYVNGTMVDVSRGVDPERRIHLVVTYHGMEIDSSFEESVNVPVTWKDR